MIEKYITIEKLIEGGILLGGIFFQEYIKELAHSIKVGVGFKSNISQALFRDKKVDEELRDFVATHDDVCSAIVFKVTNGGGIPKEGSPLNSGITHPTEKKHDWPVSEVSPFFRGFIQRVYTEKRVLLPIEEIPMIDPTYSYLKSQKENILVLQMTLIKEKRKCRYILSIRLLCTAEEFNADNRLKENIRRKINEIRKHLR